MSKKYNIIGDIHGRTCWKNLIINEGINIFVGDYFSPYDETITWEQQKQNFLEIVQLKIERPETILLIGNHDEDHWHWSGYRHCSRHDYEHENEIRSMFEKYQHLFQAAYSIDNQSLITHAGMSILWYFKYTHGKENIFCYHGPLDLSAPIWYEYKTIEKAYAAYKKQLKERFQGERIKSKLKKWDLILWKNNWYYWDDKFVPFQITPNEAANFINNQWKEDPWSFAFSQNADYDDCYGTTPRQSPMWIRIGYDAWEGLNLANIFRGTNYTQIFGHTINRDFQEYWDEQYDGTSWYNVSTGHMIMIDCLEEQAKSYVYETKD